MLTKILRNKWVVRVSLVLALGDLTWWGASDYMRRVWEYEMTHGRQTQNGFRVTFSNAAEPVRWAREIDLDMRVPVPTEKAAQGKSLFAEPEPEIKLYIGERVPTAGLHTIGSDYRYVPKPVSKQRTWFTK